MSTTNPLAGIFTGKPAPSDDSQSQTPTTKQGFVPVYDTTLVEYSTMNGAQYPINSAYALMPGSARALAALFSTDTTVTLLDGMYSVSPPVYSEDTPWRTFGPFGFNHAVPFLTFVVTTPKHDQVIAKRNAAWLASYWGMPGVPAGREMYYMIRDIATPIGV